LRFVGFLISFSSFWKRETLQPSPILFDPFATEQDKIFDLLSLEIEAVCEDDATKKYESRAAALLAGRGSRAQTLSTEHGSHKIFMLRLCLDLYL